jgi:hypothetical protein
MNNKYFIKENNGKGEYSIMKRSHPGCVGYEIESYKKWTTAERRCKELNKSKKNLEFIDACKKKREEFDRYYEETFPVLD